MTKFNKKDFTYYGGYLHYTGDYTDRPVWPAVSKNGVNVHPSRVGKGKDLFIARFKYGGPFTKAKFVAVEPSDVILTSAGFFVTVEKGITKFAG